jgi:uncharacterized protein (DUF305 family)
MAALVPSHSANADLRLLAEKIECPSAMRSRRCVAGSAARHEALPDSSGHQHQHELMPGMLTEAELEQLGSARGSEFDRLFLTFMIRHHEGALTMVARLFSSAGAVRNRRSPASPTMSTQTSGRKSAACRPCSKKFPSSPFH